MRRVSAEILFIYNLFCNLSDAFYVLVVHVNVEQMNLASQFLGAFQHVVQSSILVAVENPFVQMEQHLLSYQKEGLQHCCLRAD